MKKYTLIEPGKILSEEAPIPTPSPGEVLVKLEAVGICGTDMQVFKGNNRFMSFPIVPFHEGFGTVVNDSPRFKKGDKVVFRPIIHCGECYSCKKGKINACENFISLGVQNDGLASDYYLMKEEFLHDISDIGFSLDSILIEPLAVAVHAIRRAEVENKSVLVVGCGTIGNLVSQVAKAENAKRVICADLDSEKLDYAVKCGIKECLNLSIEPDIIIGLSKVYPDFIPDVMIDCAGHPSVITQLLPLAAKTSRIVIVGNYSKPVTINITDIQRKELEVIGSITYDDKDFEKAIELISSDKIFKKDFVGKQLPIEEIQEGMEFAISQNKIMKTIFYFKDPLTEPNKVK